jgi:hypothetical protein
MLKTLISPALDAAENHPERFAEFMQGMVSRARANPDPYSAEAQIVMEEMIRYDHSSL